MPYEFELPDHPLDQGNYRIDVKRLDDGVAAPEQWYWHLYFRDEKVNGGISGDEGHARSDASTAMYKHSYHQWREHHYFDQETFKWVEF